MKTKQKPSERSEIVCMCRKHLKDDEITKKFDSDNVVIFYSLKKT